jgi:hypothetical protein
MANEKKTVEAKVVKVTEAEVKGVVVLCTHGKAPADCATCSKTCNRLGCDHAYGDHSVELPHVCLECDCAAYASGEVIIDE